MEKHHKRALDRCMNELTDNLDPHDVMPNLISSCIMSTDDRERINHAKNTRKDAVFHFVPLLQRKGPNAFEEFKKALKERGAYEHLVCKLESEAELLKKQHESNVKDDDDFSCNEMKKYQRISLHKCMDELTNNLEVDDVMSHMITKEIMTHDDRERFEKLSKRVEKVDTFLSTLCRRGGNAFEVFVEALKKMHFYDGLVSTLNKYVGSSKEVIEEGIKELLKVSKEDETYDFILFKLAVAETLQRRDALNLCSFFKLDNQSIVRSKYPSLSVIALLCKRNILMQKNLQDFKKASEHLQLENVKLLVDEYNALTERVVEIKVAVEIQHNPSRLIENEAMKLYLSNLSNKIKGFEIGRRLRTLFRREYGMRYQRFEERSIMLHLVVPTTKSLIKLSSDIEDGKVAKALGPVLFRKEELESLHFDDTLNVTLKVTLETVCYQTAIEQLGRLEEEKARKDAPSISGDIDWEVFESFKKKIGFPTGLKRKLTVEDLPVESPARPTCCDKFLRNIESMCLRSGLSDDVNGQRSNMRDIIYAVLKCSETLMRRKVISCINSSKMAVPVLLPGIGGSKPEFLKWTASVVVEAENEVCSEESNSFFSNFTVSVLRIGESRLSKSMLLNTLYQLIHNKANHSPFLIGDTTYPRPSFSQGSVEVITSISKETDNRDDFSGIINFLNLRGDCTSFSAQTKFVSKISNLVIIIIEQSTVPDHQSTIDEIKIQSKNALVIEVNQNNTSPAHQKSYCLERKCESIVVEVIQLDVLCDEVYKEILKCREEDRTTGRLKQDDVVRFCETIGIDIDGEQADNDFEVTDDKFINLLGMERQQELEYIPSIQNEYTSNTVVGGDIDVQNVNIKTENISKLPVVFSFPSDVLHKQYNKELKFLKSNVEFLKVRERDDITSQEKDYVTVLKEVIKDDDFQTKVLLLLHLRTKESMKSYQKQYFVA